jgi:hypothetical protein
MYILRDFSQIIEPNNVAKDVCNAHPPLKKFVQLIKNNAESESHMSQD